MGRKEISQDFQGEPLLSERNEKRLSPGGVAAIQGGADVPVENAEFTRQAGERLSQSGTDAIQGKWFAPTDKVDGRFAPDDDEQIAEGVARLRQIQEIQPDKWQELTEEERLGALQKVENTLAQVQNRPPLPVFAASMGPGEYGFFDGNSIRVNADALNGDDVAELVDTIAHEGRHAYQWYAVEHPNFHGNNLQIQAWKNNFSNYINGNEDPEGYRKQPIEADAWKYGSSVKDGVYRQGDLS